ncbi:MAG: T9SS type A sorting domain-containing protein [Tannerellaceae bacterium]|jgi:uncharacterized repeat protein (TIGR02543 family)|nr:T9SS type A sorting domain-containing protein [Tannerellaceae bacterium]
MFTKTSNQSIRGSRIYAGLAATARRRWAACLLVLAALLPGGATFAQVTDVYVFLKNGHVGYLDNGRDGIADSWKTFPGGKSFGASFGGYFNEALGPSIDWTELVVENNAARHITRDRNVVFLAASFHSRAERDSFMEDGRPWKDVNKYRGRLLHHKARFGYPWDENVYLMTIQSEQLPLHTGEDGMPHVNDGYVVIEEFDRVKNLLSVEVSLEKPIELEIDPAGGYRYSNDKNAIRVVYRNAAPYPIRVQVAPPCIDYAFPARRVTWPEMNYPTTEKYWRIDFNGLTSNLGPNDDYQSYGNYDYPEGDAEFKNSVFEMIGEVDYEYKDSIGRTIYPRGAVLNIPPNGSAYVNWPMNTAGATMGLPKPTNLGVSFQVMAPAVLNTTLESNEILELRSRYFQLEGVGKQFAFFGAYPTVLPVTPETAGTGRTIYASILNIGKLADNITLQRIKPDGSTEETSFAKPTQDSEGRYPIDLTAALNTLSNGQPTNYPGKYRLVFQEKVGDVSGATYNFDFELEYNVAAVDPDAFATRLVVVQDPSDNKLSMTTYEPSRLNKDHILMTLTGTMTKENTNDDNIIQYRIGTQSLINGLLKFIHTDGGTDNVATITWNIGDGTILLATEANDRIGLNAYDTRVISATGSEAITVSLDGTKRYTSSYAKAGESSGERIILTGGKLSTKVDLAGITIQDPDKNIKLYRDAFSLSGTGEVSEFLMGASKDYLSGEVTIHESMFGENGYLGARGNMTGHVGVEDPFGIIGLGGAEGELDFDVLPNSLDRHFRVKGEFDILGAINVEGILGFAPVDPYYHRSPNGVLPADIWSINDFNFTYDGTIGVCDLTLGGGFTDLMKADLPEYSFLYNPSPVEAKVTFGLADPTTMNLFGFKGTGVLGGNRIGLIDGSVSIFGTEALHDLTATISFGATEYQGFALPWFRTTSSGRMDFFNVIHGQASLNLGVDLARSRHGLAHARQMVQNVSSRNFSGIGDYLYDVTDLEYMGKVSVTIPSGVPFAGTEIVGARVDGNKEYVRAIAEIHWDVGPWDVNGYAWVQFKFSPAGVSGGIGSGYLKSAKAWGDLPAGTPLYGYEYTLPVAPGLRSTKMDSPVITFTSNIIPVQKRKPNILLRAFGDGYSKTATETLATEANVLIVRVRSENSGNTKLQITSPTGAVTTYEPGTEKEQLNWKYINDTDANKTYYETSIVFKRDAAGTNGYTTLKGDWKVEALDNTGEIEAQLYVWLPAETVSDIALSGSNITFDSKNLEADSNYRLSFSLVSDTTSRSDAYPLDTLEFKGSVAPTSVTLPNFTGQVYQTLNGDYFVKAKLEKSKGDVQFEVGGTTFTSYEPAETAFSTTAIVTHANTNDPGEVTAVTAEPQGSATVKVAWSHSGNTNLDGFFVTATDSEGKPTRFAAPAAARALEIRAGASKAETEHISNYDPASVSIETGRNYHFAVNAYHRIDTVTFVYGKGASPADSVTVAKPQYYTLSAYTFALEKKDGTEVKAFEGTLDASTPAALSGIYIHAQNTDKLKFSVQGGTTLNMDLQRSDDDGETFTAISTPTAGTASENNSTAFTIDMKTENFPGTADAEKPYLVRATFYDPSQGTLIDKTVYEFHVVIDNTPPLLMLTQIEDVTDDTSGKRRVLSGTTEAGATLYFQGEDISSRLTGKGFTIDVTQDMRTLNFKAIDRAGNATIAYAALNADFFTGTDDTKSVKLLTPYGKNEFRLESSGTLELPVKTRRIDQNDVAHDFTTGDSIEYSVVNGAQIASVTEQTDGSGKVAVSSTGDFLLMTTYREFLGDAVLFRILPADTAVISTHSSLLNTNELIFRFDEPTDPNGESFRQLRSGSATPKEIQYSCDQTTWTAVPAAAITWFTSDSAKIDLTGIQPCTVDGVTYFRLYVKEGLDKGPSHVTGILLGELPASVPLFRTATFTGEQITPFTQQVFYMSQLDEPALPVRSGYVFGGWYSNANFSGTAWNFATDPITADITLYGKWDVYVPPSTPPGTPGDTPGDTPTGVDESDSAEPFLTPNPADTQVSIRKVKPGDLITIYDSSGRPAIRLTATGTEVHTTISDLPAGIYIVHISRHDYIRTLKLIVK